MSPSLPQVTGWRAVGRYGRGTLERSAPSLERRPPSCNQRGGILISCGARSAPYLTGLLRHLQIEETVTLSHCAAEEPAAILANGLQACLAHGPFRRFYVVVCQAHPDDARLPPSSRCQAGATAYDISLQNIVSIPSFHVWLLLHWMDLPTSRWDSLDQLSTWVDAQLQRCLATTPLHNPVELFAAAQPGMAKALFRSQRLSRLANPENPCSPTTNVHELVSFLLKWQKQAHRLRD
ncbi:MAG: hypothetical protein H7838_11870 [Magnetococcus sp. DMHC-8]